MPGQGMNRAFCLPCTRPLVHSSPVRMAELQTCSLLGHTWSAHHKTSSIQPRRCTVNALLLQRPRLQRIGHHALAALTGRHARRAALTPSQPTGLRGTPYVAHAHSQLTALSPSPPHTCSKLVMVLHTCRCPQAAYLSTRQLPTSPSSTTTSSRLRLRCRSQVLCTQQSQVEEYKQG